jgi:hypothetical protein
VELSAKVEGLDAAMRALLATFPADAKKQKQVLTNAMKSSARATMLAGVKSRALRGPTGIQKSGALSESIGVRSMSRRKIMTRRVVAGVEIAPIRSNLKAMAMYINHYYSQKGRTPKPGMLLSGIRHGHLIEFGTVKHGPQPFLHDGVRSGLAPFMQRLAAEMRAQMERNVRRARGGRPSKTGRLGR